MKNKWLELSEKNKKEHYFYSTYATHSGYLSSIKLSLAASRFALNGKIFRVVNGNIIDRICFDVKENGIIDIKQKSDCIRGWYSGAEMNFLWKKIHNDRIFVEVECKI